MSRNGVKVEVVLQPEPNFTHSFAAYFVIITAKEDRESGFLGQLHELREVGQRQALGTSWRGEGNQASGRQDCGIFFAFGQTDSSGGGGVYWVETSALPTITGYSGVSPLGVAAPMPTALAVSALVLD